VVTFRLNYISQKSIHYIKAKSICYAKIFFGTSRCLFICTMTY
jgi:hypothetical protein